MASSNCSVRVRGTDAQQQSPSTLSPLSSPSFAPWVNAYPSYPMPAPSPRDCFDRSIAPPAMHRQHTIPLPRLPGGPINPLLERTPIPMIVWDLTQCPSQVTLDMRRSSAHLRSIDQTATDPSTTSLTIRAPFTTKPIVVHRNGAPITVRDVLMSVHLALKQAALEQSVIQPTSYLFAPHNNTFAAQGPVNHAFLASLLGNRSQWAGLSPSPTEQDVWVLYVK